MAGQPNVLFFHVDDLGFGELSCYSGGPFRGVTTARIDAFAQNCLSESRDDQSEAPSGSACTETPDNS
jgi:hypothetical protein